MHHARSVLTFLFIVVSLAGATTSIAAEDTSPPSVTSHEVNVVRQVAIALAAGSDAIKELRGPPIENSNLDRLKLPTPGMDCGIARSVIYVACHSVSLNKNEAEAMFARIMDDVETALPSDSWTPVEAIPHADLIRIRSYFHRKSRAQVNRFNLVIDVIDRVPRLQNKAAHLKELMKNEIIRNLSYAHEHGTDRSEISDWTWPG